MTAFHELPAAIVGQLGEAAGAALMRRDGASMISLCRIDTGGAPVLERGAARDALVLPDFQAFNWRGKQASFVEIKTYAAAARNDRFNLFVHGIPVRLYDHYCKIEQDTGLAVYLGINELDTGALRIADVSISKLQRLPCLCRGGCHSVSAAKHLAPKKGIREMQWYFDRDDFAIVYRHDSKTVEHLQREHSRLIGGHAWQRHMSRQVLPRNLFKDDHLRSPCSFCGEHRTIMFTVEDSKGERIACSPCWRSMQEVA
jgi:hypothetical protein